MTEQQLAVQIIIYSRLEMKLGNPYKVKIKFE